MPRMQPGDLRPGQMQNPVTGSGGMLLGTVREVGPDSPLGLRVGQRVATLVSLTLTPLRITDGLAGWDGEGEQETGAQVPRRPPQPRRRPAGMAAGKRHRNGQRRGEQPDQHPQHHLPNRRPLPTLLHPIQ